MAALTIGKVLATMFKMYETAARSQQEKSSIVDQMSTYAMLLKDVPVDLLAKAVRKCMLTYTFLPKPNEILDACREIFYALNPDAKMKSWTEAWEEIQKKGVNSTPYHPAPAWSTPQIAKVVKAVGLIQLREVSSSELLILRAQMKAMYESVCEQCEQDAKNEYLLGTNPLGIIGIPTSTVKLLTEQGKLMLAAKEEVA